MNRPTKHPESWRESMRDYLHTIRQTGKTNMFGAGPYLERDYGLSEKQAEECVLYWMGYDPEENKP